MYKITRDYDKPSKHKYHKIVMMVGRFSDEITFRLYGVNTNGDAWYKNHKNKDGIYHSGLNYFGDTYAICETREEAIQKEPLMINLLIDELEENISGHEKRYIEEKTKIESYDKELEYQKNEDEYIRLKKRENDMLDKLKSNIEINKCFRERKLKRLHGKV